jgi:acyl-CoA thioesterase
MTKHANLFDEDFAPMMAQLNQKLLSVGNGVATVTAQPEAKFENPHGRMHGGFVATLIDSAMGFAVNSKTEPGVAFGTIDLNVKFVRGITVATGLVTAEAKVVHAGRTMFTVEARVVDAADKLYAHGSGSFLVYPKQ